MADGVAVSMFLAPSKYMATGTVCAVPNQTGGEVLWHPRFSPPRDAGVVQGLLRLLVSRMRVQLHRTTRVRCSSGNWRTCCWYIGLNAQLLRGPARYAYLSTDVLIFSMHSNS